MTNRFGFLALAGILVSSHQALAADPAAPPSDCGTNHDELCGSATDLDMDGYWSDSTSLPDCDDEKDFVHPGATSVIGNDIDDNCNGTAGDKDPDAHELNDAMVEAGGEDAKKWIALKADIDLCVDSPVEGSDEFVWYHDSEDGWTCGIPDGYSWVRGVGVLNETETHERETRFRIAGDKRTKAEALAAVDAKVAELGHPADDSDPANPIKATGMYAELDAYIEAAKKADAEDKAAFDKKAKEMSEKISGVKVELVGLEAKTKELREDVDAVTADVGNLKKTGVIAGISVGGLVFTDSPLMTGEGGTMVAGSPEYDGNLQFYVGGKNPGNEFLIEGGAAMGSTDSAGGTVPTTIFSVSGSLLYVKADMGIGGKLTGFGGGTGDTVASQSTHLGVAFGPVADWSPRLGHGLCSGISASLQGGVEETGFNDYRAVSAVGLAEVSTHLGICPK